MPKKAELKKVLRDIKDSVKAHKAVHKSVFGSEKMTLAKGRELIAQSRKKILALLVREEELVKNLLEKSKKEKAGGNTAQNIKPETKLKTKDVQK